MSAGASGTIETADMEQYLQVLRPTQGIMTPTAAGNFSVRHTWVDLERLKFQAAEETLPRVWEADMNTPRHGISFRTAPGAGLFSSGTELDLNRIAVHHSRGRGIVQRVSGPVQWGSMSLPCDVWAEIGGTVADCDLTPSPDLATIAVPADRLVELRRIHSSVIRLAVQAPEMVANGDVARGLENELITVMVACIGQGDLRAAGNSAGRNHAAIMRRFRRVLEENVGRPLYLPELCMAVGASDRTLRLCCSEYFGMGPKRYLLLRRLHLAYRALLHANAEADTVTRIATRFGFWELGRFAAEFRYLFGVSPSTLLRRA